MPDELFQFHIHDLFTHVPIGKLDMRYFSFNDPIWGAGTFDGAVTIPHGKDVDSLKRRTVPDQVEIFALQGSSFLWGGILNYRSRKPGTQNLVLRGQAWKAWLYTREVPTKWIYDSKDQWGMAYDLWDFAAADKGCPKLYRGATLSGVMRQFTVEPFWSVGQALDSFGQRDGGFEWSVGFRLGSQTGLPEMFLELWNIGQERSSRSSLFLDQKTTRNNISVGDIAEDASERRPRVWSTGEGGWPDQPFTFDEDPELDNGRVLLRETDTNYGGVIDTTTLFDHARSERVARNTPMNTISVDHPINQPDVKSYRSGDRARLRISDEWEDMDLRGVRIIDRAVAKSPDQPSVATVVLDLTDVEEASE